MNQKTTRSETHESPSMRLPEGLKKQLLEYRQKVWQSKAAESLAVALACIGCAWLAVFLLDRWSDSPGWVRAIALTVALMGVAWVPFSLYRWVWRRRSLAQVTRLICRRLPGAGDRLLGALDLVDDTEEQARSPVLCKAAVDQVAEEAAHWDLNRGLPDAKNRLRWTQTTVLAGLILVGALCAPAAVGNAWVRLLLPWGDTPRYTFAALENVEPSFVVAHGEPFSYRVALRETTRWRPGAGTLTVGKQSVLTAERNGDAFVFQVPAQIDDVPMELSIGDARRSISLVPTLRPELESVVADVSLPGYLQREGVNQHDVRGGSLSLVKGSQFTLDAKGNRKLHHATVDGSTQKVDGAHFSSELNIVRDNREIEIAWKDHLGLAGKEPFRLAVTAADDRVPNLSITGMHRQAVVLVSEQIKFEMQSRDDFGVQELGMQWQGFRYDGSPSETKGTLVLAAGAPDREVLNASGTFQADALGIEPQAIELRIYAKDYFPDREPALSAPFLIYVLSPDDHAIWLTEQLNKWHRRALEVRDRELQLYAENERIRELPEEALDDPETRKQIQDQANAEKSNGRKLAGLTHAGEEIIQNAMKNPEFGVGHLEKWAEMLQVLKDISANRMPSVADLLSDAAEAPKVASDTPPKEPPPIAGQNRMPGGKPGEEESDDPEQPSPPPVPQIVDGESSEEKPESGDVAEAAGKKPSSPLMRLPVTTLMGKPKGGDACPAEESMDEAVEEQKDLLAEFEKVADELNSILANLEGSTLVKRLKAASRKQFALGGSISELIETTFGSLPTTDTRQAFQPIVEEEDHAVIEISYIMDDMQAYFDRRPFARFNNVLTEMRDVDVLGSLRKLSDELPSETGVSLAQVEYWGDTMDRWAEDLVDPAKGGT